MFPSYEFKNAVAQRFFVRENLRDRNDHHDRLEACLVELQHRRNTQQRERRDRLYQKVLEALCERASYHPCLRKESSLYRNVESPVVEMSALFWVPVLLTVAVGGMVMATLNDVGDVIVNLLRVDPRIPPLSRRSRRHALYERPPRRRRAWGRHNPLLFASGPRYYY